MYVFVDQRSDNRFGSYGVTKESQPKAGAQDIAPTHIYLKTQVKIPMSQILSVCSWSVSVNTFRMAVITKMCVA